MELASLGAQGNFFLAAVDVVFGPRHVAHCQETVDHVAGCGGGEADFVGDFSERHGAAKTDEVDGHDLGDRQAALIHERQQPLVGVVFGVGEDAEQLADARGESLGRRRVMQALLSCVHFAMVSQGCVHIKPFSIFVSTNKFCFDLFHASDYVNIKNIS